jgi:hypothetical protein
VPSGVVTVTSAVGDGDGVHHLWQHHRHARSQEDAELPARDERSRLEFLSILFKMILIAHSCSLSVP